MSQEAVQGQVPPPTVDAVYEVPDDSAQRVVADRVRNNLLSVQIRSADRYNDQSRNILQQCVRLLPVKDRERIQQGLHAIKALENKLETNNNWFRKILLIMEYQRVSKETYFVVKKASNRLINDQISNQIMAPTGPQAPPPPPSIPTVAEPPSSTSTPVHPFRARGELALDSASFHNVERVDLTTLRSSQTGDSAVLLEVHTREQRTREYVATLQPTPDDNIPDGEGEIYGTSSDILGPPSSVVVDAWSMGE